LYGHPLFRDLAEEFNISPSIDPEYLLNCFLQDLNRDELLDILALGINSNVVDIVNKLVDEIDGKGSSGKNSLAA
jgi:hypothetical protein